MFQQIIITRKGYFSIFVPMDINQNNDRKGVIVVKKLRDQKLRAGYPFMINIKELATDQCYLEYPNGNIKLVSVVHSTRDLNIIKELSAIEANKLRKRLNFSLAK